MRQCVGTRAWPGMSLVSFRLHLLWASGCGGGGRRMRKRGRARNRTERRGDRHGSDGSLRGGNEGRQGGREVDRRGRDMKAETRLLRVLLS